MPSKNRKRIRAGKKAWSTRLDAEKKAQRLTYLEEQGCIWTRNRAMEKLRDAKDTEKERKGEPTCFDLVELGDTIAFKPYYGEFWDKDDKNDHPEVKMERINLAKVVQVHKFEPLSGDPPGPHAFDNRFTQCLDVIHINGLYPVPIYPERGFLGIVEV